ncbi:MAG: hypothetical protein J07HQX50_01033 [Haloquadratum sp. J07HQX50]|nr:MAG: hypothetical protein J07HQX50_01033 [Haloquadratum sp. J07HQX50]
MSLDKQRRKLLSVLGAVFTTGLAGCSSQTRSASNENTAEAPESDTPEQAGTGVSETTDTQTETNTNTEAEPTASTEIGTKMSSETETETETQPEVSLVIDNISFRAWEITEDESGSVAPLGEQNPTLTLETGQRYIIDNNGWSSHPLAIRATDDTPLLSQSSGGTFVDDSAVNWVDNDDTVAFTFTDTLADEAAYYICTVHSSMQGDIEST